jgi:glucokinase
MTAGSIRGLLAMVADIGGTKARFALTHPRDGTLRLSQQCLLPCAEFASLQHAIEHCLESVGERPARAAIAGAGRR